MIADVAARRTDHLGVGGGRGGPLPASASGRKRRPVIAARIEAMGDIQTSSD
jgi:hypothetical protein